MKVIHGVIHYTATEVSQLCGVSTQTVKLWSKASDKREESGEERLIPAPYVAENGYKFWSETDTHKIMEYAGQSHKDRYGNMKRKESE